MHLTPLDTHAGLLIRTWTRYSEPGPPHPHVDPLFRTRAISSAREPAIPSLGNPAHMQNSGLTCGTGGLRAEQGHSRTPDPLHHTRTRYSEPGPPHPHVDPLFRAWAIPPTCGTGGLHAEQGVYARNSNGRSRMGPPVLHACAPLTDTAALRVSVAGRRRSLRGSCPWRGRRGLLRVPRRRCPRASRPKR